VADIPAQEEEPPAQLAALQQQQQQPPFTPTGSSVPGQQQQQPPFTSTGSSALRSVQRQQKQQGGSRAGGSQQQAVKLDAEIPQMLVKIEEVLKRKHEPTLVGYWCTAYDALMLATSQLGLKVVYWAISTKGRHRHFADCRHGKAASAAQKEVVLGVLWLPCSLHSACCWAQNSVAQGGRKLIS
jgi:hypothetical protein